MTSMMTARRGVMAKPTTFTPGSVAGLYAWYDATQITGLADGDPVATWTDVAGGRNATQGTSAARPTYKTAIQNGRPVVRFDGVDDFVNASAVSVSQPDTIFIVAKQTSTGSTKNAYDGNTTRQTLECGTSYVINAGANVSTAGADTAWHVHTAIYNGASSSHRLDGALGSSGNAGTNALASLNIGTYRNFAGFWPGDIAELIIYTGALGSTDRAAVEAYLKAKWGTP